MITIIIATLAFLFFCIYVPFLIGSTADEPEKIFNLSKELLSSYLESQNFHSDAEYYCSQIIRDLFVGIAIDDSQKLICISTSKDQHDIIPFSEIIGCEIKEDSSIIGGVGRAVVGGVIAGGAGAIVGANTAKKKSVRSFQVIIYRENIKCPQIILSTLKFSAKTNDDRYLDSVKFANNVNASIKVIVSQNSSSAKSNNIKNPTDSKSRLIDLQCLKDAGLINNDEYDQKREEVLKSI